MGEGRIRRDIPTGTGVRLGTTDEPISIALIANLLFAHRVGVEDDVAVRLSELRELGASVVRLRGSRAV